MLALYITLGAIALVVVWVILWVIFAYNGFVRLVNHAKEAWSDIDIQLKRRYDLIPNLVNTVKGYAAHEQGTLEKVLEARAKATQITVNSTDDLKNFSQAQGELSQALGRLMAVSENYPELKANQNFLALQNELTDTENKIQAARRFYNSNVKDLNISIEIFPGNMIAKMFGFQKMSLFETDSAAERQNVEVKF